MLPPSEHYRRADRLLHEVGSVREVGLPFVKHKIALAHVHALLAQCGVFDFARFGGVDGYEPYATPFAPEKYPDPIVHNPRTVTATTTNERL